MILVFELIPHFCYTSLLLFRNKFSKRKNKKRYKSEVTTNEINRQNLPNLHQNNDAHQPIPALIFDRFKIIFVRIVAQCICT